MPRASRTRSRRADNEIAEWRGKAWRFAVVVAVSFAVLAASLYVILSDSYSEGGQRWAYGAFGMVAGYWLRGSHANEFHAPRP